MSKPLLIIAAGGTGGHMFPAQALAEAMLEADRQMVASLKRPDFREGVMSFVEKRSPKFERLQSKL